MMKLRKYKTEDLTELAQLFYDTVHTVNARDYTREQLNAWAAGQVDMAGWEASFQAHHTVVAERGGRIAGASKVQLHTEASFFLASSLFAT